MIFINSDPGVIRLFLRWLDLLAIDPARRSYRVSIHESADVAAEAYWRSVIGRPDAEFGRATLKRHNPKTVRKHIGDDYRGCLVARVLQPSGLYRRSTAGGAESWRRAVPTVCQTRGRVLHGEGSNLPGSSKGRTRSFGVRYRGSNPRPGAPRQVRIHASGVSRPMISR